MHNIEEFNKILESLPLILQYIVPGYICFILYKFTTSKKYDNASIMIVSCVISYLLLSLTSLLRIKYFSFLPDTAIINSGLSTILGIILTTIISIIQNHKWFKIITVKLFHKTPNEDIWKDVFDLDNGSNLKVYLKDKDYYIIGHHKNHEEKGDDSWLALSGFAKFDVNTNQIYNDEPSYLGEPSIIITIRFSDIEHIEIF